MWFCSCGGKWGRKLWKSRTLFLNELKQFPLPKSTLKSVNYGFLWMSSSFTKWVTEMDFSFGFGLVFSFLFLLQKWQPSHVELQMQFFKINVLYENWQWMQKLPVLLSSSVTPVVSVAVFVIDCHGQSERETEVCPQGWKMPQVSTGMLTGNNLPLQSWAANQPGICLRQHPNLEGMVKLPELNSWTASLGLKAQPHSTSLKAQQQISTIQHIPYSKKATWSLGRRDQVLSHTRNVPAVLTDQRMLHCKTFSWSCYKWKLYQECCSECWVGLDPWGNSQGVQAELNN